ncbi:MAG: NifB/NifX family molybdenum-iron cluster-binding protein [Lachnospiraceae bacterium]|nr:NifB/NifX family molybdenum-iron cluster-binding protein [Lachnospiraceae bacterium]
MARPNKSRFVCRGPSHTEFHTVPEHSSIKILLSVEEYEVLRLIDYSNRSQQETACQMGVSRTTIQALYSSARKKLSRFLVEGTSLQIQGGNYTLCGQSKSCHALKKEGENNMKIAVTYENGQVFQHFGHTEQFKVYEAENGSIKSSKIVDTNGQGHGALAGFLQSEEITVLICGGIGGGARNALQEAGIELYPGASGDADAQVTSFLQGKLQYDPDTMCHHHDHDHDHGEGHTCGEHGCH